MSTSVPTTIETPLSLRQTLRLIGDDYRLHGCSLRQRSLWALTWYRLGRWTLGLKRGPTRLVCDAIYKVGSGVVPFVCGVSLERTTRVGKHLHIIHSGLVCIHPRAVIGDRVGVMHGVTLGTSPSNPGYPTLGNDVFVGCHATILGGVTIGEGSHVAANSLVITDVPPHSQAIGVPAKVYPLKRDQPMPAATAKAPIQRAA